MTKRSTTAGRAAKVKAAGNAGKRFTSWSFSRYGDYKRCPLAAKLKHLDKVAEPGNDAMERGNEIHRIAELFIKGATLKDIGGGDPLRKPDPKRKDDRGGALHRFRTEFKALRAGYARAPQGMTVETTWAFTKAWGLTKWNDWDGCAVRIKVDLGVTGDGVMRITDWKTGKFREEQKEDYLEQLELYALGAMLLRPDVLEVRPRLAYLDLGLCYPLRDSDLVYRRADLPRLKATWDKRTRAMLLDRHFAPRPNDKCRWCWYRADNTEQRGGPQLCRF